MLYEKSRDVNSKWILGPGKSDDVSKTINIYISRTVFGILKYGPTFWLEKRILGMPNTWWIHENKWNVLQSKILSRELTFRGGFQLKISKK